jgi:hypothetical protein
MISSWQVQMSWRIEKLNVKVNREWGHEADNMGVARARCGWELAADPRLRKPKGKAVAKLPPTATKRAAAYTNKSVYKSLLSGW